MMITATHPDFEALLTLKDPELQTLYRSLRALVLEIYPDANELFYHTHALTSVYSTSSKLKNGYCHIPIYAEHLNLGFNFGTMLHDPKGLLHGTGKTIRHVPIRAAAELANRDLRDLIEEAVAFSLNDLGDEPHDKGLVLSKIK